MAGSMAEFRQTWFWRVLHFDSQANKATPSIMLLPVRVWGLFSYKLPQGLFRNKSTPNWWVGGWVRKCGVHLLRVAEKTGEG